MFVLPPPPKYPVGSPAYQAALAQLRESNLDSHNTLTFPTGPEFTFAAGEGEYTLREDIHLATPPPHPSEVPVTNPNPLSTAPIPVTAGVRITLCSITYRDRSGSVATARTGLTIPDGRSSSDTARELEDDGSVASSSFSYGTSVGSASVLGPMSLGSPGGMADMSPESRLAALLAPARDKARRKPKNSMTKSNSSFVSRMTPHESLAKRLSERSSDDVYYFANISRSFNWMDFASPTQKHEPLTKVLFTKAHPVGHDVNMVTRSSQTIDVAVSFSSGDILWFDAMSNRYNRINKNGAISAEAAPEVRWVPGSDSLIVAGHRDGALVFYDRDREDSPFRQERDDARPAAGAGPAGFSVLRSIHTYARGSSRATNPVAYWTLSDSPITSFAFSPDSKYVAAVSEDGYLRVIDFARERLVDVYSAYYGGLLCVCWSPDGRYILTGGQDDLVSIWSMAARSLVARCQGHQSFVKAVAFDPWRCDDRVYRFASVGEDCRLLFWDFSAKSLHRPKTAHRGSMSSGYGQSNASASNLPGLAPTTTGSSLTPPTKATLSALARQRSRSDSVFADADDTVFHPIASKASIPIIPPIMSARVDDHPLTSLIFRHDSIITTCHQGHIRTWNRPGVTSVDGVVAE
ncbi:WD40-repeat-containing domain protein [Dipodascopsis tothii]|uniref:WD40-repeat-containing domain protein n=1 Tax=Dipodascopsis tothii TaxID=44089 RepID=UPI0034CFA773